MAETNKPLAEKCTGWDAPCNSEQAERRRQNTQYVDDERNWVVLCDACFEKCKKYWCEMLDDYYS